MSKKAIDAWEALVTSASFINPKSATTKNSACCSHQMKKSKPGPNRTQQTKSKGQPVEVNQSDDVIDLSSSESDQDDDEEVGPLNMLKKDSDYSSDSSADKGPSLIPKSLMDFRTMVRECQRCLKVFENASDASACLNRHRLIRCYYCFGLYENTTELFLHYERDHVSGGRPRHIQCPYDCATSITYKSFTCHVISVHIM